MDSSGELALFIREVLFAFRQQLGKNQHTVQRRSQFVRHVRQELGFVLGCQRKLLGFFLQRAACPLDFLILTFDFQVLLGEQVGLFFQLFVGLLQLILLLPQALFGFLQCLGLLLQPAVGFRQFRLPGLQFVGE